MNNQMRKRCFFHGVNQRKKLTKYALKPARKAGNLAALADCPQHVDTSIWLFRRRYSLSVGEKVPGELMQHINRNLVICTNGILLGWGVPLRKTMECCSTGSEQLQRGLK